jgi:FHA domain-containing protein
MESPSTLVVDPLQAAHERALRVEQNVDPMRLFSSNNDERGLNALLNENNQASNTKSVFNHTSEMASFFRAPTARPDPAIRTQMASDDMFQAHAQPFADPPPQQQIPAPEMGSIVPTDVYPSERSTDDLPPFPSGPLGPAAFAGEPLMPVDQALPADMVQNMSDAAELSSEETPSVLLLPANAAPPAMKQFTDNRTASAENAENLMAAFKRGAELQDLSERSMTPELMETIGRLLQTAVQGTVSLLATRATVKQEIHLSVTLINPKANNPMKFLPDGQTALLQMLGPRIPGFMTPVDAMEEAFDDLMTHQTAIAAGTQAAIEALFRRFDPDTIESQNPQSSVSERISHALYDARLWNAYKNQYRQISIEVKDDFFRRLGADFHEAYNREYERNTPSKK